MIKSFITEYKRFEGEMSFISRKAIVRGVLLAPSMVLGSSMIGDDTLIGGFVCVGYPRREKILRAVKGVEELDGLSMGSRIGSKCVVRSHTVIYEEVEIEDRVETGHGVLIREQSRIGVNSRIGSFSQLDGRVEIGANVNIQSGVYLPSLTVVEDGVFIGPGVIVTNDPYPVSGKLLGVRIRRGAVIGAGAVLRAGIEIGEGAVVAAGAVVTRDVPPEVVVVGSPARVKMSREEYEAKKRKHEGEKL